MLSATTLCALTAYKRLLAPVRLRGHVKFFCTALLHSVYLRSGTSLQAVQLLADGTDGFALWPLPTRLTSPGP